MKEKIRIQEEQKTKDDEKQKKTLMEFEASKFEL